MTYKINGKQYWKRNGVYCSWTEEEGRKVITEEEYLAAKSQHPSKLGKDFFDKVKKSYDSEMEIVSGKKDLKSKVEIAYQEVGKSGKILTKRKTVTQGNLDKVISNMEAKDNFVKILGTREI